MTYLARYMLMAFTAAVLWGVSGCAPAEYQKGMKFYQPKDPAAAARDLKPLAEQGNADAQFNLGSLYYQGRGVPRDYAEAIRWMRRAADQNHVFAQTTLGSIYAEGVQGVIPQDYPQALMWFVFASAQGDMEAMPLRDAMANRMTPTQIAEAQRLVREFKPEDVQAKAFRENRALAEKGDAAAQFNVGLMYYLGQGVARDFPAALGWFKKAARQGNPYAQYNVGYMNEKGEGTPKDYVEAAKYYREAAERGNRLAQHMIGYLHEKGLGVSRDEVQALMWYSLAAIQGEAKAKAARDRVTIWMTPEQIAEAQRLAREFRIMGR
ncbi:MAG: tetratricopeptide repeat protein [Thermodesulfobacteriota bacterium]